MINFLPKKTLIILGLIIALGVVLWFWRGEIYKSAQNLYAALISKQTIEKNQQSKKDSDNVRKEIQTLDDIALDNRLCSLGIVRGNSGCNGN